MMKIQKSAPSTDKRNRRRGRPAGKNRTPLSLEERRARNAQYERERRNETADAMADLAEAAGCDPQIANAELLATIISKFQRRARNNAPDDIENLRRVNANLESQIAILQSRLGQDLELDDTEDQNECEQETEINYEYQREEPEEPTPSISHAKTHPSKGKTTFHKKQKEMQRSNKIRKTSRSSSVREKIEETESDTQSDSSSNSNWSESIKAAPSQYQLRNRNQKVSEQSQCTTSTYLYRTSESSQYESICSNANPCGTSRSGLHGASLKYDSEDSTQSDSVNPGNKIDPNLTAVPTSNELLGQPDNQTETALLNVLTEGEMSMINQWLDDGETLNDQSQSDHVVDSKVLNFLDFQDFMFEINA